MTYFYYIDTEPLLQATYNHLVFEWHDGLGAKPPTIRKQSAISLLRALLIADTVDMSIRH